MGTVEVDTLTSSDMIAGRPSVRRSLRHHLRRLSAPSAMRFFWKEDLRLVQPDPRLFLLDDPVPPERLGTLPTALVASGVFDGSMWRSPSLGRACVRESEPQL